MLRNQEDGFTLVELLIVVVILGVVGAVTVTGIVQGMRTTDRIQTRADALVELERASQRIERELRRGMWSISLTPSGDPPNGCVVPALNDAGDASSLKPDDLSLVVFHTGDRYRYHLTLDGGTVRLDQDRWDGTGWVDVADRVVIDDLTNEAHGIPLLTYVGADGETLAPSAGGEYTNLDIAKLRKYRLRLRLDVNGDEPIELSTLISPRNGGGRCPVVS